MSEDTLKKLAHQHAHRTPTAEGLERIKKIRAAAFELAKVIGDMPPSREQSLAQTNLDQARMWACNAATLDGEIREPLT